MNDTATIQFALVSHTNNGKTTLARTLVGVDVGEVRDAAHVTILAESHVLQSTEQGDQLLLWDTPGFGDSVRLLRRLSMAGNPIGWFLREVFDRYRDKAFWLSQQALRTAKDSADVVLYLVNSSELPHDAGYLPAEMKILAWLGKPVVVLLNQLGPPRPHEEEAAEQACWQQHLEQFPIVRRVLALDAFARCWVHEHVFYEAVAPLIDVSSQAAYRRLLTAWDMNNLQRYRQAMHVSAMVLVQAARDTEPMLDADKSILKSAMKVIGLGKPEQQRRQDAAMSKVVARLNQSIANATAQLIALHRLDPGDAARVNARVRDHFVVRAPVDRAQAGVLGAIVAGAATGLKADLLTGGLTMGGGALLGAIVGGLTMAGAAWGFNTSTDRQHPKIAFTEAFLQTLMVGSVLRYLAVAHFGRGRGNFTEGEAPAFWQGEVERAVAEYANLPHLWHQIRDNSDEQQSIASMQKVLTDITSKTLSRLYPGASIAL
ncbi:MAG: GTPase domain-containing protein [Pseudomonadota bacterium]|nr:GTPase domain-containing protein [Pseudomonadota bacterium]